MDPLTHAVTSWALSRAGCNRIAKRATAVLITAALVPDFDLLSIFGGPKTYLRLNHALTHSVLSAAMLVFVVAFIFWAIARKSAKEPIAFVQALQLAGIGVAAHLLLDVCGIDGVRLLWPFSGHSISWDLLPSLDPWILIILLAGISLPSLFRLVGDEIGARRKGPAPIRGALISLLVMLAYIGVRVDLHERAVGTLMTYDYHGGVALQAGAFPDGSSPLEWRGVVSTENTMEIVEVPFGPAGDFNAGRSVTEFKPGSSAALSEAQNAPAARLFLATARFPLATVEHTDTGYLFIVRDLRFPENSQDPSNMAARVTLDFENRVTSDKLAWTTTPIPWR